MVHITSAIVIRTGATKCRHGVGDETRETAVTSGTDLTIRLSDAGLRRHPTKLIYLNHRLPPRLNEVAAPRSLEPIVRFASSQGSPAFTNPIFTYPASRIDSSALRTTS